METKKIEMNKFTFKQSEYYLRRTPYEIYMDSKFNIYGKYAMFINSGGDSTPLPETPPEEDVIGDPEYNSDTTRYINASATGNGTGLDWTNAYTDIPTTLTRGYAYYIGDGEYASATFDDTVDGENYIYILKATSSSHGTDIGWNDSYGDGAAAFTGRWYFTRPYYYINGRIGTGYSGHGFYVHQTDPAGKTVYFNAYDANTASDITLKHCDFEHAGVNLEDGGNADCLYILASTARWTENCLFEDCAFHNATRTLVRSQELRNSIFRKCYFYDQWNNTAVHAEAFAIHTYHGDSSTPQELNIVFEKCMMKNTSGAGCVIIGLQHGEDGRILSNVVIDSCIFWQDSSYPERYYATDGVISSLSDNTLINCKVYGCTFINSQNGSGAGVPIFRSSEVYVGNGNIFRNNLVFNDNDISNTCVNIETISHNWYYHAGNHTAEDNDQVGSGNPFTNYAGGDLTLSANTDAGYDLGTSYDEDFAGSARTTWSRGAYEY